jgi:hypothetical protein
MTQISFARLSREGCGPTKLKHIMFLDYHALQQHPRTKRPRGCSGETPNSLFSKRSLFWPGSVPICYQGQHFRHSVGQSGLLMFRRCFKKEREPFRCKHILP